MLLSLDVFYSLHTYNVYGRLKNVYIYIYIYIYIYPLPHTPSCRSAELVKHRDNFTFFYHEKLIRTFGQKNWKDGDRLEDKDVDGRAILKFVLGNSV
jgi:hypothetical protein